MKPLFKTTVKISILFISMFVNGICSAQSPTGQLLGKVKDEKTKSILDYATIRVKQDSIVKATTSSDEFGDYTINNLSAGEYTLEISYLGYSEYIANGIIIKAGSITHWNCMMEEKDEEDIIYCIFYCPEYKLIEETDNKKILRSKDILKLPIRD